MKVIGWVKDVLVRVREGSDALPPRRVADFMAQIITVTMLTIHVLFSLVALLASPWKNREAE